MQQTAPGAPAHALRIEKEKENEAGKDLSLKVAGGLPASQI
jgi:hypothetical protein